MYITLLSEDVGARATYVPAVEAGSVSCRPRWERNPVVVIATPAPPRCGVGPEAPPADRESVPGGTSPVSTWMREKKATGIRKSRYSFFFLNQQKGEHVVGMPSIWAMNKTVGEPRIAFPRFLASSLSPSQTPLDVTVRGPAPLTSSNGFGFREGNEEGLQGVKEMQLRFSL